MYGWGVVTGLRGSSLRQVRQTVTRAAIEARILSLYADGYEAEAYSISDLSRKADAAYPHVHATVVAMEKEGLLKTRELGRSRYCTVCLENDMARNLLAQADVRRKADALKKPNLENLDRMVRDLTATEPGLLAVILHEGSLLFVIAENSLAVRRRVLRKVGIPNISFSTPEDLGSLLLRDLSLLRDGIVLFGYERILLLLLPFQERLLLNHGALFRGDRP